jgi:hypothetical protein
MTPTLIVILTSFVQIYIDIYLNLEVFISKKISLHKSQYTNEVNSIIFNNSVYP